MPDPKKCTFRINGEVHSTGVGEKDCAAKRKAWNKFKKERNAKMREELGMRTQDSTKTTDPKPKNNIKKKAGKIVTELKKGLKRKSDRRKKRKNSKRTYNPYD